MNARLSLLLLAAAAVAGCTKNVKTAEAEAPPVTFPHQPHVENDVACTACHGGIEKATKVDAKARHIKPDTGVCKDCHDPVPKLAAGARGRDFAVNFDHAAHLPRVNGDCKRCHSPQSLPQPGMKERPAPPMAACTGCHNHQQDFVSAKCTPCHRELRDLKPETAFAHTPDWLRAHGQFARPSAQTCGACHDQTYCAECHAAATAPARPSVVWPEAVDRDLIHRGDYVSRHMVDAASNPASCRRCHGSPFCNACHELNNVAALALQGATNDRDPHPPGWVDRTSGNFHGYAAKANIVRCAGCHDQGRGDQNWCARCHRPGGVGNAGGFRPHPLTGRYKPENIGKQPCLNCHLQAAP